MKKQTIADQIKQVNLSKFHTKIDDMDITLEMLITKGNEIETVIVESQQKQEEVKALKANAFGQDLSYSRVFLLIFQQASSYEEYLLVWERIKDDHKGILPTYLTQLASDFKGAMKEGLNPKDYTSMQGLKNAKLAAAKERKAKESTDKEQAAEDSLPTSFKLAVNHLAKIIQGLPVEKQENLVHDLGALAEIYVKLLDKAIGSKPTRKADEDMTDDEVAALSRGQKAARTKRMNQAAATKAA